MESEKTVWDPIWKSLDKLSSTRILNDPASMTLRSEVVGLLLEHFDLRNKKILEVGCGCAQYGIEFSKRRAIYTGVDIDPGAIKLSTRIAKDYEVDCEFQNIDLFDIKDQHFDIVFSMGTVEHFSDEEIIKMFKKMGELGDYVVTGVPYSKSKAYMLSKSYSQRIGNWEYGIENDFLSLSDLFQRSNLKLLQEKPLGLVTEAFYLNRMNPNHVSLQIAENLEKKFKGEDVGSWLVAIGSNQERSFPSNIPTPTEGISIIIPIRDGEQYIERLVKNLDRISYPNLEVIFVNDGSTDNTQKELEKYYAYVGAQIINFKRNVGVYKARLKGLKKARYDWVYFLDADDLIWPNCISNLMNDIRNCPPNTHLSSSDALMKEGRFTGEIWFHEFLKYPIEYINSELVNLCGKISLCNTIIKKEGLLNAYEILNIILKKVGIKRMKISEDSMLLDIMVNTGYIDKIIPIYYSYRGYDSGESASGQIDDRIRDIPLEMAYCFKMIKGNSKLKKKMASKAIKIYGKEKGELFMENFEKYRRAL